MIVMPSLSEDGWVTEGKKLLDYIISHYLTTDYRQSYIYNGSLKSLSYSYSKGINNPNKFKVYVQDDLTELLQSYFTKVELSCELKQDELIDTNYSLVISSNVVTEKGEFVELYHFARADDGIASAVVKYSNYGDAYNAYTRT